MRRSVKAMLLILAVLFVIVTAGSLLVRTWLKKTNYQKDEDVVINREAYEGMTEAVMEPGSEAAAKSEEEAGEAVSEMWTEAPAEAAGETLTEPVSELLTEPAPEPAKETGSEVPAASVSEAASETPTEPVSVPAAEGFEDYDISRISPVTDEEAANTFTLLVIGGVSPDEESDPGKRGDADAVIIMTINHKKREAVFYSFDTDLYVLIPQIGGGHLGNAYAVGGGPLLAETMEKNYGLHIDNYASISFKDVARIMEMPEFETLDISKDGLAVVKELVYSLGRLKATQVTSYISQLMPYVTHNLDPESMLRIILQIPRIIPYYGVEGMVPGELTVRDENGFLVPDAQELAAFLRDTLYGGADVKGESLTEEAGAPNGESLTEEATPAEGESLTEEATPAEGESLSEIVI